MDRASRAVAQWRAEFPDWDLRPMEILGRMAETWSVIDREHLTPLFVSFGLQGGEFDVLATLRRSGPPYELTPTELFEVTMTSSGGMTARLDRLERKGLVKRRQNPDDRRGVLVGLTEDGVALVEKTVKAHLANEARIVDCLSDAEKEQFSALLSKLLAAAQQPPPEPER